jgi:hypothetical protein
MNTDFVDQYAKLEEYARVRTGELSPMLQPYVTVTDRYGQLICGVVSALGKVPPTSQSEATVRDLMADVFDFLYETRPLIVKGKLEVAYPLARRAYESLSLMVACEADTDLAKRWQSGKQIGNAEVRAILDKHPRGEDEANLKQTYKFFSMATHPNREMVAGRLLGEGNQFVLGSIGAPSLALLADYAMKTLSLWFWFAAFCAYSHRELMLKLEPSFGADYLETAKQAREVHAWLAEQYRRTLAEEQGHVTDPNPPA